MLTPESEWNAFEILGLPVGFVLDMATLHRAYMTQVAEADRRTGESRNQQLFLANWARDELADPARRAMAILKGLGLTPSGGAKRALPNGFLEDMLAKREEFDQAVSERDSQTVARLRAWAVQRRETHIAAIDTALRSPGPGTADAVVKELNAWRYVERMLQHEEDEA